MPPLNYEDSDDEGFPCSCGKVYSRIFDCIEHQKRKHGIEFQCFTCFCQFQNKQDLKAHLDKMSHYRKPAGGDGKAGKSTKKYYIKPKDRQEPKEKYYKQDSPEAHSSSAPKASAKKYAANDSDSDAAESVAHHNYGGNHYNGNRSNSGSFKKRKHENDSGYERHAMAATGANHASYHHHQESGDIQDLEASVTEANESNNSSSQALLRQISELEEIVESYRERARTAEKKFDDLREYYESKKERYEFEMAKLRTTNKSLLAIIGEQNE